MKPLIVMIGSILAVSLGYAAPDLACEAILEPSGYYCLADSAVTPRLKISNLGDQGASNFFVRLVIVDPWRTGDTVYLDSAHVGYIDASPEYKEVEFPEWMPEGHCAKLADGGPFVEYELSGITCLSTDADQSNDTLHKTTTCLLAHDVGVIGLSISPDLWKPPAGTKVTFTVTLENLGFNLEQEIPVRCEVVDKTADPDTLVWSNTQLVSVLNWRGDTSGGLYTADVEFPIFKLPSTNCFSVTCKTRLEGDLCPDDDIGPIGSINKPMAVEEDSFSHAKYDLHVISGAPSIRFTLPRASWVRLDVYDASGVFVRNLYNDPCSAGSHSLSWDERDSQGTIVSSGAYFIKMQADDFGEVKKTLIVR